MKQAIVVLGALLLVVVLLVSLYRCSEAPSGPPSPDPYPDTTEPVPEYTEPYSPAPTPPAPDPVPNEYVQYDSVDTEITILPDTGGVI